MASSPQRGTMQSPMQSPLQRGTMQSVSVSVHGIEPRADDLRSDDPNFLLKVTLELLLVARNRARAGHMRRTPRPPCWQVFHNRDSHFTLCRRFQQFEALHTALKVTSERPAPAGSAGP